ncbi:adenylate kinase [archaeon]|nr:adenylate kinase [archaeon]
MTTKNKIVILTGIPGSGKTTVLESTLELLQTHGIRYESVNYGTQMFEIAKKEGYVKNRDELRKMDSDTQKKIQTLVGEKISKISLKTNVVVDTHCTIKTPAGYLVGLPEWVSKSINPNVLVLIEGNAMEIHRRRMSDDTRVRDSDSEELIDEHQQMNRSCAISVGILTGATTKIIKNNNNELHNAVNELLHIMK